MDAALAIGAASGRLGAAADIGGQLIEAAASAAPGRDGSGAARRLLVTAAAGTAPLPEDGLQQLAADAGWRWQPRRRPAVKRSCIARAPQARTIPSLPTSTVAMLLP